MLNYNTQLQSNNADLQTVLQTLQTKAAGSGISLPELTNEGIAADLISGKQLIDDEGNIVTGTFTIDSELTEQDNLISQIQSALESKSTEGTEIILQNKTIVPTADLQLISADEGYDALNEVTIEGDENLIPENILRGVSIFGVDGAATGSDSTYTLSVQNNIPEEYGFLFINGYVCYPNEITEIPTGYESPITTFVFMNQSMREDIEGFVITYEYEGDDGIITETVHPEFYDNGYFIFGHFEFIWEQFTFDIIIN